MGKKNLTPELLRRPRLIVPCSVFSLALGLQLFYFLLFPQWNPEVHERMIAKRLTHTACLVAFFCVSLPIGLLYYGVKHENEPNE